MIDPYWKTTDEETCKLYFGDTVDVCSKLEPSSVHCVVTSPPYWGLRYYDTTNWEGGDEKCDHDSGKLEKRTRETYNNSGNYNNAYIDRIERGMAHMGNVCKKCGAKRVDKEIGSETIPDCGSMGKAQCGKCFLCKMVEVFRGVRRVMRSDGVLWLNLGDTYAHSTPCGGESPDGPRKGRETDRDRQKGMKLDYSVPSGNLLGMPWRTALALQSDGWILRQDIIWAKPNPMPESVTNRCTKSHEYIFMFTLGMNYYFDSEAIKEESIDKEMHNGRRKRNPTKFELVGGEKANTRIGFSTIPEGKTYEKRNKRSVWNIASQPTGLSHFATFPEKLILPCILSSTSEKGCCPVCKKQWVREKAGSDWKWIPNCRCLQCKRCGQPWSESCGCGKGFSPYEPIPSTVFDPFMGSGTTAIVALENRRRAVGIDLSEKYIRDFQIPRVSGVFRSRRQYDLIP